MRPEGRSYYVAYCPRGHRYLGSNGPDGRCTTCGREFVERCDHCKTRIQSQFRSAAYSGSDTPVNVPARPTCCDKCGKPFPWGRWHRHLAKSARAAGAKAWQEFKGLSKTHLIVLAVVVLLIVGALKVGDIKALLGK